MNHYVAIRYNVKFLQDGSTKEEGCRFNAPFKAGYQEFNKNEEWLSFYASRFHDTMACGLRLQSTPNFRVLLMVDSQTPSKFIHSLRKSMEGLRYNIIFIDSKYPYSEQLAEWVNCFSKDYNIITRCDIDDALMPTYLEEIQNQVRRMHIRDAVVGWGRGQAYDLVNKRDHQLWKTGPNMFCSTVEKCSRVRTPYCVNHSDLCEEFPFVELAHEKSEPMWTIYLHERNIQNDLERVKPFIC